MVSFHFLFVVNSAHVCTPIGHVAGTGGYDLFLTFVELAECVELVAVVKVGEDVQVVLAKRERCLAPGVEC